MIYFIPPILIVIGVVTYLFLMIFYPEWVGISGAASKENIQHHQEEQNSDGRTE